MPKFKVKRGSTWVDMTAMCDVSFLLLTFFILTAKFRPAEIVPITTPTSRAENAVAEDMVTFSIDKDGKAYMSIGKPERKTQIIEKLVSLSQNKYGNIDENTQKLFTRLELVGVPIQQLPQAVKRSTAELTEMRVAGQLSGIPMDSTNNQLGDWVQAVRYVYAETDKLSNPPVAIKGDRASNIKGIKRLIEIFKEKDVYKYKLVTSLENKVEK
ncbi:MAG TPA: biopolymer transporter ExbD [Chitinophagales bacterium]|nr:biopolymer transporter ExbD [Chitinophagales bacterium]HMW12117.1 biopolymer transporter ExbD [Chitinophagales bacterium]HMX59905.1 biopolymer transporter ExbD [Chitinophagales bacterium]HMY22732.1 biopolymer transporter ExbD [Chitinophagales bacterium]HMZ33529.1 biopolymer transporter ExbD [Chitinophagales bacterium]